VLTQSSCSGCCLSMARRSRLSFLFCFVYVMGNSAISLSVACIYIWLPVDDWPGSSHIISLR
jgi:hypothetical protein